MNCHEENCDKSNIMVLICKLKDSQSQTIALLGLPTCKRHGPTTVNEYIIRADTYMFSFVQEFVDLSKTKDMQTVVGDDLGHGLIDEDGEIHDEFGSL
jgi:hypothetical protein